MIVFGLKGQYKIAQGNALGWKRNAHGDWRQPRDLFNESLRDWSMRHRLFPYTAMRPSLSWVERGSRFRCISKPVLNWLYSSSNESSVSNTARPFAHGPPQIKSIVSAMAS